MSTIKAREWVSHVMAKVVLFAAALICVALMSAPLYSQPCEIDRDCYAPDSAYYLPFTYSPLGCSDSVEARIRVYLWCDGWASHIYAGFNIVSGGLYDTVHIQSLNQCAGLTLGASFTPNRDTCVISIICSSNYLTPGSGVFCELTLRCSKADSTKIEGVIPFVGDLFSWWQPLYVNLDTSFAAPHEFISIPGDVNCSQQVSISDAVYLINYIFAGGCSPCDLNAADVNGNCAISISDVVYLINYIFAGGNAPEPGCVVP